MSSMSAHTHRNRCACAIGLGNMLTAECMELPFGMHDMVLQGATGGDAILLRQLPSLEPLRRICVSVCAGGKLGIS